MKTASQTILPTQCAPEGVLAFADFAAAMTTTMAITASAIKHRVQGRRTIFAQERSKANVIAASAVADPTGAAMIALAT